MADLRDGLRRPLMRRDEREAIARAEVVAAHLMQAWTTGALAGELRRIGDPPSVRRLVLPGTVRVHARFGLVAEVRGYLPSGDEDRGLHCKTCPLGDLEVVGVPRG